MTSLAERPVVRTGRCSLILVIDSRRYRVSPAPPLSRGSKIYRLTVLPGQVRAGTVYSVCSTHGHVDCTCPDSTITHAVCKHIRALQALGLVAKTAKPTIQVAWENTQPSRRRKPPVTPLGGPFPSTPPVTVETRRRQVPALAADGLAPSQADPADGFAVGWKNAVQCHVQQLASKGGLS
jgi:hypothetical protein